MGHSFPNRVRVIKKLKNDRIGLGEHWLTSEVGVAWHEMRHATNPEPALQCNETTKLFKDSHGYSILPKRFEAPHYRFAALNPTDC
jgi:hypothetical protein